MPEVHWPYSNENVLVIERINGLAVNDVKGLEAAGIELKVLAERGVEIFFTQVFKHNFPRRYASGNIFVGHNPKVHAI